MRKLIIFISFIFLLTLQTHGQQQVSTKNLQVNTIQHLSVRPIQINDSVLFNSNARIKGSLFVQGDILSEQTLRINANTSIYGNVYISKAIIQNQLTGSISEPPTTAQINSLTGLTPSTAGVGYQVTITQSMSDGIIYRIESDGSNWFYTTLNQAP